MINSTVLWLLSNMLAHKWPEPRLAVSGKATGCVLPAVAIPTFGTVERVKIKNAVVRVGNYQSYNVPVNMLEAEQ